MSERRPCFDRPGDELVLRVDDSSTIQLKAVAENNRPIELNPADAREIAKRLAELADEIAPEEQLLPESLYASLLRSGGASTTGGMKWPKFTLRDMLWSVVWFALGFAPIGSLLKGGGPLSFFAIFSLPCFGAGIGAIFQRKWTGFNCGVGVMVGFAVIVPVAWIVMEIIHLLIG